MKWIKSYPLHIQIDNTVSSNGKAMINASTPGNPKNTSASASITSFKTIETQNIIRNLSLSSHIITRLVPKRNTRTYNRLLNLLKMRKRKTRPLQESKALKTLRSMPKINKSFKIQKITYKLQKKETNLRPTVTKIIQSVVFYH